MASLVQFTYDGQIRRFVTQFMRMVSNYQVEFGKDASGNRTLQTVPVYYGSPSHQADTIIRLNSENPLNAVPAMATYINALTYDRARLQNPYHESYSRIVEQTIDPVTQMPMGTQGGSYSVERLMPAPYKLQMKLDIWTSNTDQKQQLLEQMLPLYNPGFEIQSTDNFLDWTSLSVALLTEVSYTNRTVPLGTDDNIDIASLTFELPIWLSLPAKVKKAGVVAQIIANIYDTSGELNADIINTVATTQMRFTPLNYDVVYVGNTITLYQPLTASGEGTAVSWQNLITNYGTLTNGISQIRLSFDYVDGTHEIVGTVAYNPANPTQLLFTPDAATLPANTLAAVTAIIDPFTVSLNNSILNPTTGTRYLILNPIGDANSASAVAWTGASGTNLIANANDIIQWNGTYWTVVFDSNNSGVQYVTNLTTQTQYVWNNGAWSKSYQGIYKAGTWSLVI